MATFSRSGGSNMARDPLAGMKLITLWSKRMGIAAMLCAEPAWYSTANTLSLLTRFCAARTVRLRVETGRAFVQEGLHAFPVSWCLDHLRLALGLMAQLLLERVVF